MLLRLDRFRHRIILGFNKVLWNRYHFKGNNFSSSLHSTVRILQFLNFSKYFILNLSDSSYRKSYICRVHQNFQLFSIYRRPKLRFSDRSLTRCILFLGKHRGTHLYRPKNLIRIKKYIYVWQNWKINT